MLPAGFIEQIRISGCFGVWHLKFFQLRFSHPATVGHLKSSGGVHNRCGGRFQETFQAPAKILMALSGFSPRGGIIPSPQ
jgi:hypothetical protein